VETEDQRDYLVEAECDTIQGYFFSRPLSLEDAMAFCSLKAAKSPD
jgi:EAL domain-containing protein (putative c-di-GMP-specific phosphodiesterase class I)